ncbi:MAG: hypothetical protein HFG71_09765 [Hungatella sp.]|jgi:hypothetical protein|nr:hypothetical protein [Hungatella sp.]
MRERINRLAKGIIDMDVPQLTVQPLIIDEEIKTGERKRGDLVVSSDNGIHGKGLVYSSNYRVKVLNSSFGGMRCYIGYEVNGKYLEYGETIEGSFYLVTNGGEKEVPYSFRLEAGNSGKILSQLKEAKDFAALARRDYDLALRLFEFRDFAEAPFMQDMGIRAVYDGLRGQGNRFGQLEQFFIALRIKEPVKLHVEGTKREYYASDQIISDMVEIRKEGWGYLPVTVKVEGGFIQSLNRTIQDEDFVDGICRFPYEINPVSLHGGKNYGSITVETMYESIAVDIEAHGMPEKEGDPGHRKRGRYGRYLSLRLEYEAGKGKKEDLERLMAEELEQLRMSGNESMGQEESARLSLMQAELMVLLKQYEEAKPLLEACKDLIFEQRMEEPQWYCLYEYVSVAVYPDKEKRESLRRLLGKYVEEGRADYLLFYLCTMCDETWSFENPGEVLSRLKVLYGEGCRSPFMYQQALSLWNQMPQLLYGIGAMELQALNFGAKKHLVSEELAVKAAKLSGVNRHFKPLCCRMLKNLYECYERTEILEAVCSLMIRGGCQKESDFIWYDRAVKKQLSLTRLYEYFLYSLPKDYKQAIPKHVLLYFSYEHDLERGCREALYENLIRYVSAESSVYKEYERSISQFAVEQALESRISSRLAVIYEEMIYADMIDSALARALPALLRSYRISCSNRRMKYVVICYEELTEEAVYPLEDGVVYVPIFSKEVRILFQDAYGNRYTGIGHVKTRVLDKPELEKRCFEMEPDQPMLLLAACKEAAAKELDEEGRQILERAISSLPLHNLYRKKLMDKLIQYYKAEGTSGEESRILPVLAGDAGFLSKSQKDNLCQALVNHGYMKEAYDMLTRFGASLQEDSLQKLCSRMILDQMFDQDDFLLAAGFAVFEAENADSVILDYLCEHFNGSCQQMYGVLLKGVKDKVETYDLEERLLGQMMFTGNVGQIDKVFALYVTRKKTGESIVRAYFTIKSSEYFLRDVPAMDKVFSHLEGLFQNAIDKGSISTIYLLALSKYYSGLPKLTDDQKKLCQMIVDQLLEDGMVFPYFKLLGQQIRIPEEIMDKAIFQYVGPRDGDVELQIRILPQEERFHRDEMRRMYQGIFVKQKVLFEGEIMEYEIYERKGGERVLVKEGSVACDVRDPKDKNSRFCLLNQMSLCLNVKEEEGLREAMAEYVQRNAAAEQLFKLL